MHASFIKGYVKKHDDRFYEYRICVPLFLTINKGNSYTYRGKFFLLPLKNVRGDTASFTTYESEFGELRMAGSLNLLDDTLPYLLTPCWFEDECHVLRQKVQHPLDW